MKIPLPNTNLSLEYLMQMQKSIDRYCLFCTKVNVIVGVGDTCLENTMDLLKFVEQAGADGVLLINPYFSVYSTDMVEAYFGYVASHTSLPIIIYNFPDLTGYCFNADVVARIVKANPNVVGIKDTIADFIWPVLS